jgi:hypothetical protein
MAWYSWITGGSETAGKVVDGVISGVDAMFYTDEEKSIANQKILDWKLKYAQASSGQNIARRLIAVMVSSLWAIMLIVEVVAKALGFDAFSEFVFNVLKENLNTPFSVIIGFYFLAHITRGLGKG